MFEQVQVEVHQRHPFPVAVGKDKRLRQPVRQQKSVRQTGQPVMLGHMGDVRRNPLRLFGHGLRPQACDNQALVRLPQLPLGQCFAPSRGLGIFVMNTQGRFAQAGVLLAQLGGAFAQGGHSFTRNDRSFAFCEGPAGIGKSE